jgi:6-phosphogluconolactonase (cycloisomerase 2 family)
VLTNTGNQPLAISSATAVGANVSDFQASNNCSSASPLATGGTCSFNVTFSPTATGPRRASVSVVDSAPGSPHSVELTGVGTAVSLSPASESFTSQTVGTSSGAQTIVLTNVGSVPLNVFAVALTGANAADFSATNTCSSVAPSGTCNIAVTFTPAAAGSLTATLLVGDDGGGSPQPVPLSGIGVALDSISVDPARVAISQGSTQPLTAAGTFSDGTKRDLTAVVNWSSSATAVAEVSNVPGQKGLTTGIAAGAASITAELGSASGSASVVTLPEPRFAYVASLGRSTILGYAVNATTGELTANGEVSNAPSRPSSMAADPSGRYLYVADTASDRISAYVIDSDVGALAEVPGSPFRTGRLPSSIGVHPTGRFIYVANSGSGSVSAFSVDPATGTLTSLPGSPIEVGGAPAALAMDPSGRFALIADSERSALQVYVVEDATGELVRAGEPPVRLAKGVSTLAIDPTGRFVYVADSGLAAVSAYAINPETGLLTEVRGSPFRTRLVPASVAVDPSGRFVYVANSGAGSMSAYAIDDATGGLSTIPGSPFPAGSVPSWLTIDPSGKFLYVANHGSENISGYAINPATGELLPVRSSPFATGSSPLFVTTTRKVQ